MSQIVSRINRRTILKSAASGAAAMALCGRVQAVATQDPPLPEPRALTQGPKFHWFGYYDKLQFDPTGRFITIDSPYAGNGRQLHLLDISKIIGKKNGTADERE